MADVYTGITVFGLGDIAGNAVTGLSSGPASQPAAAVQVAGWDGTNFRVLSTTSTGALNISGSITASNAAIGTTGSAVPASASYTGIKDGSGNLIGLSGTTTGLSVVVNAALPAGTNVIGHVIADSGSTTAVTGNVTVVQTTGTNLHAVVDSGTITTVTTVTNAVKVTGNSGTAFDAASTQNVAAPGAMILTGGEFNTAPTTITTGNVSPLQLTAAANLKVDITTVAGTAPTTAGFIDIKGADGNVFVRQATAANLNATVVFGSPQHVIVDSGTITATNPSVGSTGSAVPTSATFMGVKTGANLVGLTTGSATSANSIPVVIASDQGSYAVTIGGSLPAGTNTIGSVKITDGTNTAAVIATINSIKSDTSSVAGSATATAASGVQKVGIVGNAAGVLDAVAAATAPANVLQVGGSDGTNLQSMRVTTNRTVVTITAEQALSSNLNWFSADTGITLVSLTSTEIPIISIQAQATKVVTLRSIELSGNGTVYRYRLIKNPGTLTTSSFATILNSTSKVDTAATTIALGAGASTFVADSGYVGSQNVIRAFTTALANGSPGDVFTIAATALTGSTAKCLCSIQWSESTAAL